MLDDLVAKMRPQHVKTNMRFRCPTTIRATHVGVYWHFGNIGVISAAYALHQVHQQLPGEDFQMEAPAALR